MESRGRDRRDPPTAGEPHPTLTLSQEAVDGHVVYDLQTSTGTDLAHFLFVDGYLVVGPSRALLVEAVAQRAAGITLVASSAFLDLLPHDGQANYSGVVYQNLGGAMGALGEFLGRQGGIPAAGRERLTALAGEAGASLAVAYGESQATHALDPRRCEARWASRSRASSPSAACSAGFDEEAAASGPAGLPAETPAGPQA